MAKYGTNVTLDEDVLQRISELTGGDERVRSKIINKLLRERLGLDKKHNEGD